jgi:hypothetical protein
MMKEPILQIVSDKMLPRHVYEKVFTVRFPDRSGWNEGFRPDRKVGLIWYTDGSKTKARELVCTATAPGTSLGRYTTVFEAEVYAIKAENLDRNYRNRNIYILTVRQHLRPLTNTRLTPN